MGFAIQIDVFCYGHVRDGVQFLEDHRDAVFDRGSDVLVIGRFPIDQDLAAGISCVDTDNNFHQRRFTGAVFSHQGVDCTFADFQ